MDSIDLEGIVGGVCLIACLASVTVASWVYITTSMLECI
jgi:hypothetical protein